MHTSSGFWFRDEGNKEPKNTTRKYVTGKKRSIQKKATLSSKSSKLALFSKNADKGT